jgi:hypothetical protein
MAFPGVSADDEGMETRTPQRSSRALIWIGLAVVAIIVVAAVAIGLGAPEPLDPTSPEGAVQGYLQAVLDGDEFAAVGFLTPELRDRCNAGDLHQAYLPESSRVVLIDSSIDGDDALVDVKITESWGPTPLDSGEYSFEETFELRRIDEGWAISEIPWPMHWCEEWSL